MVACYGSVLLKVTPEFEGVVGKYNFNCEMRLLLPGPDNQQLYCADGKSVDGGWDGHVKAVPVRLF